MEGLKTGMPVISTLLYIKNRTAKASQINVVAQFIHTAAGNGQSCAKWEGSLQVEVLTTLREEGYDLLDLTWNGYPSWIISWY